MLKLLKQKRLLIVHIVEESFIKKTKQKRLNFEPFSVFYYLVLSFIYILAIPYLIFKSRNSKYTKAIPAKFFLKDNVPFKENGIWFHSCSMGETKAIKPLIDNYLENANISVITNTDLKRQKISSNVRYLPFEIFLPFG